MPFIIAVQTRQEAHQSWSVGPDPLPGFRKQALVQWAEEALIPVVRRVSDVLVCPAAAAHLVDGHERVGVGQRKKPDLAYFHWVYTLLGNITSSIQGTYYGFTARYLGEFQHRFNRRFDWPRMVPRLLCACLLNAALPENWLRTAEGWG